MFLLVLAAMVLSSLATFFFLRSYLFPREFTPTHLTPREEQVLEMKLERLEAVAPAGTLTLEPQAAGSEAAPLEPEAYSEEGATREIRFTERELNALLAKNTDLADKLAIDLTDDLVSAKLLVPLDEDVPILGGKTLRVKAGLTLAHRGGQPVVVIRGISVMGVPLPNAWLGGIKNLNLVQEFGQDAGFWKAFADGVEEIVVEDGQLTIRLKE